MSEEEAERRRLDLVETRVEADGLEVFLVARAVKAEEAHPRVQVTVVRDDETAVPDGPEALLANGSPS